MKYEILKTFTGRGVIKRGAVVEDPNWKNLGSLIRTGYVREVPDDAPAETAVETVAETPAAAGIPAAASKPKKGRN